MSSLLNSRHLLSSTGPLAAQIAAHLLDGAKGRPVDLGDTLVLVPTGGAARAVRRELAKKGVLSPQFRLPLDAMLPAGASLASRLERQVMWALLLDPAKQPSFAALVPATVPLDRTEERFGIAERLCHVCDQLTEAGLDPSSPALREHLPDDALRWEAFGKLYARYLDMLSKHGLNDPNDVRLRQSGNPAIPPALRRVVVACVPDMSPVVRTWLQSLGERGAAIDVLSWSPSGQSARLDAWGRPDKDWWIKNPPRIPDELIIAANDPASEAGMLLDHAAQHAAAGYALFAAAPESSVALAAEIARREEEVYLPEGKPLAQSEWAGILLGREKFLTSQSLRDLRSLLHRPAFLAWFVAAADHEHFDGDGALRACDLLLAERLCETVDAARSWLKGAEKPTDKGKAERAGLALFVRTAENVAQSKMPPGEFLAAVAGAAGVTAAGSDKARELSAMAETLDQFARSSLLSSLAVDWQEAALRADIHRKYVFAPASSDAVEIQGWLEAPWSCAPLKIMAGCREGALPAGIHEDAFLPDQARRRLGLMCQDARFARDAYLFSCLLAAGPRVLLGTSRFRSQGEPNRPSRLLFSCEDEELPRRAAKLLRPSLPAQRRPSPVPWHLHLPRRPGAVESIRVTGFKNYLQCPLRFYLQNVCGLDSFDPEAREIDRRDFGTILHRVLEEYGRDPATRDLDDPEKIGRAFDRKLDEVARRRFGPELPPVALVQLESMRARLRGFAPLQAEARSAGWEIIATEKAVQKNDDTPLSIGPLRLTGTMDRVEVNTAQRLLRVLDYKTFGTPRTPAQTHLAAKRDRSDVPSAACTFQGKTMFWKDLQLPLYRHMIPHLWPEHKDKEIGVGYVLMPADIDDTSIEMLPLDDDAYSSAVRCAAEVAGLVAKGVFWPPSGQVAFDNFADWFRWSDPEEVFDRETRQLLGGAA